MKDNENTKDNNKRKRLITVLIAVMVFLSTVPIYANGETEDFLSQDKNYIRVKKVLKSTVSAKNDDAEVSSKAVNRTSTGLNLDGMVKTTPHTTYLRFNDVNLPEDAVITKAYIAFTARDASSKPTQMTVNGELGTGSALGSTVSSYTKRNFSDTKTVMTTPEMKANEAYHTENLTDVINEMYTADKTLQNYVFKIEGNRSGTFIMDSYDSSAAKAPGLMIEYTTLVVDPKADQEPDPDPDPQKKEQAIETAILSSNDDAEVSAATVNRTSTGLNLDGMVKGVPHSTYLRFTGIRLPADAYVTDARLIFATRDESNEPTELVVSGETGAGDALGTTVSSYTQRSFTKARVNLETPQVTADQIYRTENLTRVINEMRGSKEGSENYVFKVEGSRQGNFIMRSFNSKADMAPKLVIKYNSAYGEHISVLSDAKNDAEEYGSGKTMDLTSVMRIGGYRSSAMTTAEKSRAAFRFPNVDIPENAEIENAYLEFQTGKITSSNHTSDMRIRVESGDAAQYTTSKNNISERKYGALWVPFQMSAIKTINRVIKTPNLKNIINENLMQDWKSGQSLAFMFDGDAYIGGVYQAGSAYAPKLVIQYKYTGNSPGIEGAITDPADMKNIYINELSAESTPSFSDGWAELYNDNDVPVVLGKGTYISDKPKKQRKWSSIILSFRQKGIVFYTLTRI